MENKEILKTLLDEVAKATEASRLAKEPFSVVSKDIPSGLPSPDGAQRIHNVSSENAQARKNLQNAQARLEHFRTYGFVPKDLR